jgi:uncharacterized metal-binding protein
MMRERAQLGVIATHVSVNMRKCEGLQQAHPRTYIWTCLLWTSVADVADAIAVMIARERATGCIFAITWLLWPWGSYSA